MRLIPLIVAHAGEAHLSAGQVMRWWSFEPLVVGGLLLTAVLYTAGLIRLWRHAGRGKGIGVWQAAAFAGGWLSLVIALVSPLDKLSEVLFSAHMTQHEVMMVVAAPLFALGKPLIAFLWALPKSWRIPVAGRFQTDKVSKFWTWISGALVATVLHGLALWIWHAPALYEATLRSDWIHGFEHTCFLLSASLFWWALIHGRYGRMGYGVAVLYVFVTSLHSGALAALLTFSSKVWYPYYQRAGATWNFDAVGDQQLAGLIMWVPAGVIVVVLGIALFAMWLAEAERRVSFTASESLRPDREE